MNIDTAISSDHARIEMDPSTGIYEFFLLFLIVLSSCFYYHYLNSLCYVVLYCILSSSVVFNADRSIHILFDRLFLHH